MDTQLPPVRSPAPSTRTGGLPRAGGPRPPRRACRWIPAGLLLGMALAWAGCSPGAERGAMDSGRAEGPLPEEGGVVLADGRLPAPDRNAPPAPPALVAALEVARSHWNATEPGWEEEFQVMEVARGAFTRPGAPQEVFLYLASRWPRCCPKMGMAVVEEGRVVRHLAFVGVAQRLRTLPDLDGDGRDELWMEGTFGMGGSNGSSATLLELPPQGGVREWGTVPTGGDSCASGGEGRESRTYRILALPGPRFTVQGFRAACEAEGWETLGEPEPLVLDPGGGMVYVTL